MSVQMPDRFRPTLQPAAWMFLSLLITLNPGNMDMFYEEMAREGLYESLSPKSRIIIGLGYSVFEAVRALNRQLMALRIQTYSLADLPTRHDTHYHGTYFKVWEAIHFCNDEEAARLQAVIALPRVQFIKDALVEEKLEALFRTKRKWRKTHPPLEHFQVGKTGTGADSFWIARDFPPCEDEIYLLDGQSRYLRTPGILYTRMSPDNPSVLQILVVVHEHDIVFTAYSVLSAEKRNGVLSLPAYHIIRVEDGVATGELIYVPLSSLPSMLARMV